MPANRYEQSLATYAARNARIKRAYAKAVARGDQQGAMSKLARRHGISRQRVWQILNQPEESK